MIFNDGVKKAGVFKSNIYKQPIITVEDLDQARVDLFQPKLPKLFE